MATKFSLDDLSAILGMLKENDVSEFKLELADGKLWLRRGQQAMPQLISVPTHTSIGGAVPATVVHASHVQPAGVETGATEASVLSNAKFHEVRSPMVGTFYRRPAVDADPYVEVGEVVKKGDVLCIVEAMKLMNEIESDVSGKIIEVCLEDGQMAEYGEVLFRIEIG